MFLVIRIMEMVAGPQVSLISVYITSGDVHGQKSADSNAV